MPCEKSVFRFKKFGDVYLISTDIGSWMFLQADAFDLFMRRPVRELDSGLYQRLRERHFIVDTSFLENEIEALYVKFKNYFSRPTLFIVGVTDECNLKCDYCQANARPPRPAHDGKYSDLTIEKTVDFIFDCIDKKATIEFQGGEPLLEFQTIKKFIEKTKKRNHSKQKRIKFTLSTNLTLLDSDKIKYLSENQVCVVGSIDGPQLIHDRQRKFWSGRGSYSRSKQSFENATRHGVPQKIISVATKNTLKNIKAVVDEFAYNGMSEVQMNWPQRNGRAIETKFWKRIGLSSRDYFKIWKESVEYIAELNKTNKVHISERYLDLILYKILTPYSPTFMDWRSPCGAAIGQLSFDHKGTIYPCDEARGEPRLKIGNVHQDSYKDVIKRRLTRKIIGASLLENEICDYCVYKPFCGLCPVLNYKSYKSFHSYREFVYRCNIFTAMFDYVFHKILIGDDSVFSSSDKVENFNVSRTSA
jgi:His-Xaa-Ser system radical SAM maturase HxsB